MRSTAGAASTVCPPVSPPGQNRSASRCRLLTVNPVTATTPGSRAGYQTLVVESGNMLPVQATITTSCRQAYAIAAANSSLRSSPPRDMLMTLAPWSTAHRTPAATTAASSYLLASSRTRTGRILASGASPTTPESSRCPAINDATVVPCPTGSNRPSCWGSTRSIPGNTDPARSSWFASTPESSTATITPRPVDAFQAAAALSERNCHCSSRTQSARAGAAPMIPAASTAKPAVRNRRTREVGPRPDTPRMIPPNPINPPMAEVFFRGGNR